MDFEFKNRYIEPMSEDIPLIKVNSEELKSLDKDISKKDREDMYLSVSKDTIPFKRVIIELDESTESLYITRTEYSFDTIKNVLDCKWALKVNDDGFQLAFKWSVDFKTGGVIGKVFFSKELNQKMDLEKTEMFKKFAFETNCLYKKTLNLYLFIMGYILKSDNVIYKEDAILQKQTGKQQITGIVNKNTTKVIPLTKPTVIVISDVIKENNRTRIQRKSCDYQFSRRGHWARSKKTGKKWWVKEAIVNADKPLKQSIYKLK